MILSFVLAVLVGASVSGGSSSKLPLLAVGRLQAIKVDSSEVEVLQESMTSALIGTRRVRVMERAQVDRILSEQGFQESGACDVASCAVKAGQLLGVDRIVVGSVGRVGRTTTLNLRSVDVASGEILGSSTRTVQGDLEAVIGILPQSASELVAEPVAGPNLTVVDFATVPVTPVAPAAPATPARVTKPGVGGLGFLGFGYDRPGPLGSQVFRDLQGERDSGVVVTMVVPTSPAHRAGLKVGDRVLRLDGQTVLGVDQMRTLLLRVAPGDEVVLGVRRGSTASELRLVAAKRR